MLKKICFLPTYQDKQKEKKNRKGYAKKERKKLDMSGQKR